MEKFIAILRNFKSSAETIKMDCDCLDCTLTEDERENKNNSRRIDATIKGWKQKQKTEIKLLLLGTGESGKSTFIRQMRIIYDNGFDDEERIKLIGSIMQNILQSMKTLIEAMSILNIDYECKSNIRNAQLILAADSDTFVRQASSKYASAIKELWADAGIQECFVKRPAYQLIDSIRYYVNNIDRITAKGYLPTNEDILHVRIPTIGLVQYTFKIENFRFVMVDVGGQRSERRKWLHCFDNVKAILFLVAISEYDQVLMECDKLNRVIEAKNVFDSICHHNEWFGECGIILFLNKIDLFQEKIMYSDLNRHFPDYKGPKHDDLAAREFILSLFINGKAKRQLYKHYTCATDTENIKIVFCAVKETILDELLKGFGVL